MELTKQRWIILAASCLINLCIGSLYAWSVFAAPMAEYLSAVSTQKITNLTIIFMVANCVGPVTMISGGFVNDKLGPKWVILVGGLLFGGGMLLSGFAKNVGMLIASYGFGVGLGMGMVYGCTVSNIIKFFPDRRGLAGGLAVASYGISSVLIPPIANVMINAFGIIITFRVLGIIILAIICMASFFIKGCPPDFTPHRWEPSVSSNKKSPESKDWKKMLADPIFYNMILILCCGAFSGLMVISQASAIAQRLIGMSAAQAAVVVSVLALLNTAGRVIAGSLSDTFGIVRTLIGVFIVSVFGLLLLYFLGSGDAIKLIIGISCVGISFGSIMGIFPGFTAAQFGAKNNSVNYGIMFIGFATAGYFGPSIMSAIYAANGTYQQAFLIAVGLAAAGILLTCLYGYKMNSKKQR
jgi:MFS family permease